MADERFMREHRLCKRPEFLLVYKQGRREHGRLAVIFCRPRPEGGPWRVGLTATRKTGGSVVRNRLRRRLREFFRRQRQLPAGWDFVVNLKPAAREAEHEALARDLARILGRLGFAAAAPERRPAITEP